jgi:P-type Cu+ transporter
MAYAHTHDALPIVPPAPIKAGAIYTCPMHQQIRQAGPGNCPICGMTLELVKATAVAGENHELTDMTRRFWVGLVLALPVFVSSRLRFSPRAPKWGRRWPRSHRPSA